MREGIKLGLDNTRALLGCIGNPHQQLRCIHIAGTNGKGSVAALLAGALREAGFRTGLFTSPHLVSLRERFRVDLAAISAADLSDAVLSLRRRADALFRDHRSPTFFEFLTALAFYYFRRREVDLAVIEVGMGGRLDASNVITPLVSVITSIDLDHTVPLGDTIPAIAAEKAGIIKPRVPVICGETKPEATDVMRRIAEERQAPLLARGVDFDGAPGALQAADRGQPLQTHRVRWGTQTAEIRTSLVGRHQSANCAVAWAALQVLRRGGLDVDLAAAEAGMGRVVWPARFHLAAPGLLIDAAHNPAAVAGLKATLDAVYPNRKWSVLVATMKDKPWPAMLREIRPLCRELAIAAVDVPRAAPASELERFSREQWPELPVRRFENAAQWLRETPADRPRLVLGSIYLAGDVLAQLTRGAPVTLDA